jgi:uncharacterized membrane protein
LLRRQELLWAIDWPRLVVNISGQSAAGGAMRKSVAIVAICAAVTIMGAVTARAQERKDAARAQETKEEKGFTLCNRTKLTVRYAMALNRRDRGKGEKVDKILSEGWYVLAPNECKLLWPGVLKHRYYLIYAEARNSNRRWEGNKRICASDSAFKIEAALCPSGHDFRNFIQVDTGDSDEYTYDLN